MHERVVEIILFLVSELRSNKRLSEVDVSSLMRDGYTQSEISSAFSWLFERLSLGQSMTVASDGAHTSHRMLNEAEKMIFESQAYGYLLQCRQLGILSHNDVETIIERTMAAGFVSIGLQEIKSIVAGYLFDRVGNEGQISLGINDTVH